MNVEHLADGKRLSTDIRQGSSAGIGSRNCETRTATFTAAGIQRALELIANAKRVRTPEVLMTGHIKCCAVVRALSWFVKAKALSCVVSADRIDWQPNLNQIQIRKACLIEVVLALAEGRSDGP